MKRPQVDWSEVVLLVLLLALVIYVAVTLATEPLPWWLR